MLAATSVLAIRGYQRFLSPYKGFCCAWRVHTGRASCSEYARRLVERRGVIALFTGLPRQFERCRRAFVALAVPMGSEDPGKRDRHRRDRCDLPLDTFCDAGRCLPDMSGACDGASGCDLPCDCSF